MLHFLTEKHIISKIRLCRFTVGIRIKEISGNVKERVRMKANDCHWCCIAMDKSTDVRNRATCYFRS
jgi:hypothetical protein